MARKMNITEKLSFDGNPKLVIKDEEYEVNADAFTVMKTIEFMSSGNPGMSDIMNAYESMFSEGERKRLKKLGLNFPDLMKVVESATALVTDVEDESVGE